MAHKFFSFMDSLEDQVAKLHQMEADYPHLSEEEQKDFYVFLVSMLKDPSDYEKETYRQAVFCFQHFHQQGLLTEKQQRSVFRHLYSLCDTELFRKRLNFSIAVSKTLREFYSTENFPKGDIQKCYNYLMANMEPIRGFNAYWCQRCWHTTFKQLIKLLKIKETDEVNNSVYAITNLNIFQKQLKDSYNKKLNEKMNAFYNLFFKDGFIRVIGKGDKERLVPISDKAIREIGNYMEWRCQLNIPEAERDYLFLNRRGKHMTRVMVFLIIKDAAEKAGIQKNISPHTFRHSFATHLVNGGADLRSVQEMLGHESILTTELYTHLDQQHLHDTIMLYHPRK